jgi:hypothetical protein
LTLRVWRPPIIDIIANNHIDQKVMEIPSS